MGIINNFLRLDKDIKLYIINNFSEAHVRVDRNIAEDLIITIKIRGENSFETFTEKQFKEKYILKGPNMKSGEIIQYFDSEFPDKIFSVHKIEE